MDGIHDLGGMHGFGPVEADPEERGFHAWWEAHVVACVEAGIGLAALQHRRVPPQPRAASPVHYLQASYFEQWLDSGLPAPGGEGRREPGGAGGENPVLRHPPGPRGRGCGHAAGAARPPDGRRDVHVPPAAGGARPASEPGDPVVTRNAPPLRSHAPARATRGASAASWPRRAGPGCSPTRTPTGSARPRSTSTASASTAKSCGGASAEPRAAVYLDLWESYLDPA